MERNYPGQERRKFKRYQVLLTVVYHRDAPMDVRLQTDDKEKVAAILDISEGGLAIQADVKVDPGTQIWVTFTLSKAEGQKVNFFGSVEVMGKVCYCHTLNNNQHRLGISFSNLAPKIKAQIADFLRAFEGASPG